MLKGITAFLLGKSYTDKHGGGSGSGDMLSEDYDADKAVKNAGGIAEFVDTKIEDAIASAIEGEY